MCLDSGNGSTWATAIAPLTHNRSESVLYLGNYVQRTRGLFMTRSLQVISIVWFLKVCKS